MKSDMSTESNFHNRFLGYILYFKVYSGYILAICNCFRLILIKQSKLPLKLLNWAVPGGPWMLQREANSYTKWQTSLRETWTILLYVK